MLSSAMRTILLGTGSPPPNPKRRGPATLVTIGGSEHFLVDAGSGVGVQLVQAGTVFVPFLFANSVSAYDLYPLIRAAR